MRSLFVTVLVVLFAADGAALAVTTPDTAATLARPSRLLETSNDGSALLKSMLEKTKQMKAYSLDSVLYTFKGGKKVTETGRLYFKSPNLVRFEVIDAGKRSGAIVVRQADGKIRGKMGGALSGIKVTLSPESKLLKSANDFSVLESDLGSLLGMTIEQLGSKNLCLVGNVPGVPTQVMELVDTNGTVVSRMTVDEKRNLPEQWSLFKDNNLFSTAKFSNLKTMADLPDSTFSLEGRTGKEESSPTLIASERSMSMSLAEYRLRVQEMKSERSDGETLAGELKYVLGNDLDALRLAMIEKALEIIRRETEDLASVVACQADTTTWAPGGKERLVVGATQIELLLSALDPVGTSLEKHWAEINAGEAKGNWSKSLNACRQTVALLIDELDHDTPDSSAFEHLRADLQEQVNALENARQEALKRL